MKTLAVLRATTNAGDVAWVALLATAGALVGIANAAAGDPGASAPHLRLLPLAAVPLMFRYQFGSAPAVLFWFDAARQAVPGVTAASLRAELLRLGLLLSSLLLPMAVAGLALDGAAALPALATMTGVAVAAAGVGAVVAVMPYRWMPIAMLAPIALAVLVVAGGVPAAGATALLGGLAAFGACAALAAWRLRDLLGRGVDPAVGGDYAFVFSFGRHAGSVFSAPDSAPLAVLLRERRERREGAMSPAPPSGLDARVSALLGESAWRQAVSPLRHLLSWAAVVLAYPLLMLGFFALVFPRLGGDRAIDGLFPLLFLTLLALWSFVMLGAMHQHTVRALARSRTEGDSLDAELRLLPGVAAPASAWARRLRPLWLPLGLATGGVAVLVAALGGVTLRGVLWLVVIAALQLAWMRLTLHAAVRAPRSATRPLGAAGAAIGLALLAGLPLWVEGLVPAFDAAVSRHVAALGIGPQPVVLALVSIAVLLLGWAARRVATADGSGLLRTATR